MYKKLTLLYTSQAYKALLPIIFIPLIIKDLGEEQYGMVSFFSMLLGWLGVLDAGVSGTFIKLVTTSKHNKFSFEKSCNLFFKILRWFLVVSATLSISIFLFANYISTEWLKTKIEANEAIDCIRTIGLSLSLNYLKIYLSSFLNGMEKQHLLAGWSIASSTALYAGSYGAIFLDGEALLNYFYAVLFISALDLSVIAAMLFLTIRQNRHKLEKQLELQADEPDGNLSIHHVFQFSLQLSGLSIIWVIATQIDKLILSRYVALNDYAHYQIAAQLSMLIPVFISPLSQYLMPRLSALHKENKSTELIRHLAFFLLFFIVLIGPVPFYFFLLGEHFISAWIQNQQLGNEINLYAKWLVASSYIGALMNFMFILRYALDLLKKYFYAYAMYSAVTIPISIMIAKYWGAESSAQFLFAHSFLFMSTWGAWSMHKIASGVMTLVASASAFVSTISFLIFYIFSQISANDSYSNFLIKVAAPPIINFFVIISILWLFKNNLWIRLDRCRIRVA